MSRKSLGVDLCKHKMNTKEDKDTFQWVQKLPKFDLHVHLDGSMRLPTVIELVRTLGIEHQPSSDLDLHQALTPPQRCSLEDYLQAFKITLAVLQGETTLERSAYELCEDAARENVIYMEIRFAPLLHLVNGLRPHQVVEAVLAGMHRAESIYPIKTGLILCGMKQELANRTIETAQLAAHYLHRGVIGFDLAGPEKNFPPALHHQAIAEAKKAGLHVTIHAGEGCCPEHIKQAIDLGAERIGHGVYLYQDPATETAVCQKGITLEACPTSNLQISGVMNSYSQHPFKRYFDMGIPITINTDNRLMSRIDVTHELEQMIKAFSLSPDQVKSILLNSANAAFTSEESKEVMRKQVEQAFI